MPEGPETKRAADEVAKAIVQQPIVSIFFAFDHLKSYEKTLAAERIVSVRSHGKALLIRFGNNLSIYSHNQLYGKWYITRSQIYPTTNRQLRLAIHTAKKSALLYSASDIAVLNDDEVAGHPFLKNLGVDVLDDATVVETVRSRFLDKQFARRGLTGLLLDQHFLCGLGNYLRSEILFVAQVHPSLRPVDCSAQQIERLAEAAIAISQQSYLTKGVTNNLEVAAKLKQQGFSRRDYRHYVFNREGKACFLCGSEIVKAIASGRRIYSCPHCQAL
ncbi:MAG TPA: endonuclease VIII [Thermosynechococcaceae cyanobacterium]